MENQTTSDKQAEIVFYTMLTFSIIGACAVVGVVTGIFASAILAVIRQSW